MKIKVPAAVQREAREGLILVESGYGGKGLTIEAIKRAQRLASGEPLNVRGSYSVERMRDWFARHVVDYRPGWENPPTPGYVAWLIWGGDAGKAFVDREVERLLPEKIARLKRKKA